MLDKVTVAVKCRPMTSREKAEGEETFDFFKEDEKSVTTLRNKFKFKHIFTPESTTREVFENIVTHMLDKALLGYNGTILAYGQTGSGKTYTLGTELMGSPGITEMLLEHLFQIISIRIKLSVVEVYLKDCFDLLHIKPLKLNIQGLKPVSAALVEAVNLETAKNLLKSAMKNRRVGATASNEKSSRSHVIITVVIETNFLISKLNIVDLAGSEKIVASAGTLRNEGVAINEALLSLGRVVNCLALAKSHIPFRDSTLTHLLEDSLNHNNYITLIACINSIKNNMEESEKTLEFASKFGGISASRQTIATPYKTPSRFVNHTFSTGNSGFKKPLTPLNKTIATTPVHWVTKKREQPQDTASLHTPLPEFRTDILNSSNISLNLSNVSSSTAIPESSSPPQNRMDSLTSALNDAYNPVAMTPANFDNLIKVTVERAIKNTIKKEMAQIFKSQLNVSEQKENKNFTNRLQDIAAAFVTNDFPAHNSSCDSDYLQTTVLVQKEDVDVAELAGTDIMGDAEPVSTMPKITSSNENLNGSYISGTDSAYVPSVEPEERSGPDCSAESFKKPAPRRSYRLSAIKGSDLSSSDRTSDRKNGNTDSSSSDSEILKKSIMRRCLRRSVLKKEFEESESDDNRTITGDNTDSSLRSDKFITPPLRRSVRRSVLRKKWDESSGDETSDNKGGKPDRDVFSGAEQSKRAPRRSMRLSVINRPYEETEGGKTNEAERSKRAPRRSMRFSVTKRPHEETYIDSPKKARRSLRGSLINIDQPKLEITSHEERILRILQKGSAKELCKLSTVGAKTAGLILNDRLLHGPLKSIKDYTNIRGLTVNQVQKFLWANSLI